MFASLKGRRALRAAVTVITGLSLVLGTSGATLAAPSPVLTLTSSANPSVVGQSVTFTATGLPSGGAGTISFDEGTTTLDTESVSGGGASFTTAALGAGHHSITANYAGDGIYPGSTSNIVDQVVLPLSLTIYKQICATYSAVQIGRASRR